MIRRLLSPALIVLVALCAAVVAGAASLMPRVWSLQLGAPGDAYFVNNSFPPEQSAGDSLRWTRESSQITLHGAYGGAAALALRLYHDEQGAAGQPWPVTLADANGELARFAARPGWRRYLVVLPPGVSASELTLSSPAFQPSPSDPRELGVALSDLRVAPLAGGPPAMLVLGRICWLGWLLGLVGATGLLLDRWALGASAVRGRRWRVLALVAGLGGALALWAWRDPASFAWALPNNVPLLGWASVALLALAGLWSLPRTRWLDASATPISGLHKGLSRHNYAWIWVGGLALAHLALLLPWPPAWRESAAVFVLWAPGALAALALLGNYADVSEQLFLAAAGGVAVAAALTLGAHALPGPLSGPLLLGAADALSLLGLWALRRPAQIVDQPRSRRQRWLLLPLLVAVGLRLWGLGNAEFQGDEAYAMMLAKGVLHGQPDILLVHMKGPVEALLPAGPLALAGTIGEWGARLPFALAGAALPLAAWALAGRLIGGPLGERAGFVAALGLAADGLLVAFGRIVQYQTVVLLLSAAAVWLGWRFADQAPARRTLLPAAFCAAVAVLAHYDGAYIVPALGWLVVRGLLQRGFEPRRWLATLAAPLAVGSALTLSFYGPFVAHEHFGRTLRHLGTRSGQGQALVSSYNNLPAYGEMLSLYATPYVAAALGLTLLGTLGALLIAYTQPRAGGLMLAGLLALGAVAATLGLPALTPSPELSFAGLLVAPPLLALLFLPRLPVGLRTLALWLTAPLLAHAFLLADPRTHFYTLHVAGWLLAGYGVARLADALQGRLAPLRAVGVAVGASLLLLSLSYTSLVFLRPWPEFERAYPATQLPFFAPFGGERLPDDGLFGFPHRDGWKVAAELFRRGELRGSFDSNQELFTSGWYLRGQFKCVRQPDYFLTANNVRPLYIPPGYSHYGTISVEGVRSLEIYSRLPAEGAPRRFEARDYAAAFDAAPVPNFPLRRLLSGVVPQTSLQTAWRDGFSLRGFDLDRQTLAAGDTAFVTLYWRANAPVPDTLDPAIVVQDAAGRTVGEAEPFCSGVPAAVWHTTYVNDTPFRLDASGLAPGSYTLLAGVRDSVSGAWLPLADGAALQPLTTLTISAR